MSAGTYPLRPNPEPNLRHVFSLQILLFGSRSLRWRRAIEQTQFASETVVATNAPFQTANWIAKVPTPPAPPWIKTFWSAVSSPWSNKACHAVKPEIGTTAACMWSIVFGFGAISAGVVRQYSAAAPSPNQLFKP
jgi:hypothetical protein